jgi:DNA-binding NarL/FixJ family response regulator
LRVVIADDHLRYRKAMARKLRESGVDVVGEAATGHAAIRAVKEASPDVAIMDVKMPGLSGVEATRRLTNEAPATRVLMLSVSVETADLANAIQAGAYGYVLKDGPIEDLIAGIRAAASGHPFIATRVPRGS